MEFVNFLKNPQQYLELGAKIPKVGVEIMKANFFVIILDYQLFPSSPRVPFCQVLPARGRPCLLRPQLERLVSLSSASLAQNSLKCLWASAPQGLLGFRVGGLRHTNLRILRTPVKILSRP